MTISIGTDPELFLRNSKTNELIPACGLLGGSKEDPRSLGDGYYVQEDNVMLEFNVPPTSTPYDFASSVSAGLEKCLELVRTSVGDDVVFATEHELLFENKFLTLEGAQTFGCSPEFDAYNMGQMAQPVSPKRLAADNGQWRFAGGHVHLGYRLGFELPEFVVAKFADVIIGLPSVGADRQPKRRELYGQAGRYRPTKYGIEYRTLSNFWVQSMETAESVGHYAYSLCEFLERLTEERAVELHNQIPWADVQAAINGEDSDKAADVLRYCHEDLEILGGR